MESPHHTSSEPLLDDKVAALRKKLEDMKSQFNTEPNTSSYTFKSTYEDPTSGDIHEYTTRKVTTEIHTTTTNTSTPPTSAPPTTSPRVPIVAPRQTESSPTFTRGRDRSPQPTTSPRLGSESPSKRELDQVGSVLKDTQSGLHKVDDELQTIEQRSATVLAGLHRLLADLRQAQTEPSPRSGYGLDSPTPRSARGSLPSHYAETAGGPPQPTSQRSHTSHYTSPSSSTLNTPEPNRGADHDVITEIERHNVVTTTTMVSSTGGGGGGAGGDSLAQYTSPSTVNPSASPIPNTSLDSSYGHHQHPYAADRGHREGGSAPHLGSATFTSSPRNYGAAPRDPYDGRRGVGSTSNEGPTSGYGCEPGGGYGNHSNNNNRGVPSSPPANVTPFTGLGDYRGPAAATRGQPAHQQPNSGTTGTGTGFGSSPHQLSPPALETDTGTPRGALENTSPKKRKGKHDGNAMFPRHPRWCSKYDANNLKEYYPAEFKRVQLPAC